MGLVKVVKNRSYFSRFQVKKARRRQGKTDYYARTRLVKQDKRKYNAPKYRMVVRFTNTQVICQIISATVTGDLVAAQAHSSELTEYGVPVGHANYAAAYCTGLLLARRMLTKVGLDKAVTGVEQATGEEYHPADDANRTFKAVLDVGLKRTTTGSKLFGALKGAVDGGLNIPHKITRFPGYVREEGKKTGTYEAEKHKERIFGEHVAEYMRELEEEEPEEYQKHFSRFIKAGLSADDLEPMYTKAHKLIREKPVLAKKQRSHAPVCKRDGKTIKTHKASYARPHKMTNVERKERVKRKIAIAGKRALETSRPEKA